MHFTVATYNIHKGFSQLNRRMVIHELRERLAGLDADILFLQEVEGVHERHAARHRDWPAKPQHEFIADTRLARGRLRQDRDLSPRPSRQRGAVALSDHRPGEPGHLGASVREPRPAPLRDQASPRRAGAPLHQRAPRAVRARPAVADPRAVRADPRDGAEGRAAGHRRRLQRLAAQGQPRCWSRSSACTRCSRRCAAARRARSRRCCRCSASTASTRAASRSLDAHVHYTFRSGRRMSDHAALAATFDTAPARRDEPVHRRAIASRCCAAAANSFRRSSARSTAPSAKSGSRPTSSPTTTPAASSPRRWCRAAQRGVQVRVLVDGWGARHYLTRALEDDARRGRRRAAQVPAGGRAVAVPLAPAAAAASQAVPRRRAHRLRRRHQRHRRHEHAGAHSRRASISR